jgi:RNA polymerase sigma-70 factor, ECF subfamily
VYRVRYRQFVRVATAISGNPDAAHDAVQEAFADVLRYRRSYRGEAPLEAWVWRAVVNAAHGGHTARRELAVFPEPEPATNGDPGDDADLRRWLAALPERQRLAVFLRYYADLDYRTIASVLDVEIGTVSATLSTAHAALRKALTEARR